MRIPSSRGVVPRQKRTFAVVGRFGTCYEIGIRSAGVNAQERHLCNPKAGFSACASGSASVARLKPEAARRADGDLLASASARMRRPSHAIQGIAALVDGDRIPRGTSRDQGAARCLESARPSRMAGRKSVGRRRWSGQSLRGRRRMDAGLDVCASEWHRLFSSGAAREHRYDRDSASAADRGASRTHLAAGRQGRQSP